MLGLGDLRKEAPLRWAAVIAIRLVFVVVAVPVAMGISRMGDTCMSRRTRSIAEVHEIRKAVGIYATLTGRVPTSLADLLLPQPGFGGDPILELSGDPWGHPYGYLLDGPGAVAIIGLGADGLPGGVVADEDIVIRWPGGEDSPPR